jgi:hypothetical protein
MIDEADQAQKRYFFERIKDMLNRPIPRRLKLWILGLIVIVVIGIIPLLLMWPRESSTQKQSHGYSEPNEPNDPNTTIVIIVPGLGIGDYMLGMSKDDVLKRLGEPKEIGYGGESYTLNNLPRCYYMSFGDISLRIEDDTVMMIAVGSPLYKLANGLGVGAPEKKIKQAFGDNFRLNEGRNDFLTYEDEGLMFEIHKKDRTVIEISVTQKITRVHSEPITIVPGLGVGDYTLGMSKDEVLKKLGEPGRILSGGKSHTLNNLPKRYYMTFSGIAFEIVDDSVNSISVYIPLYKFANGLGVGDPEEKIKQAFGDDFNLKEGGDDVLTYEDEGLKFKIHEKDRKVTGITVTKKISRGHSEPNEPNTITIVPELGVGDYMLGMSIVQLPYRQVDIRRDEVVE